VSLHEAIQSFIVSYGQGKLETLKLLIAYIKDRNRKFNKNSLCATYEGLRKWMTYRKVRRKFTTVERDIRKLAELGTNEQKVLYRKFWQGRKNVIFCLNPEHPVVAYLLEKVNPDTF